MARVTAVVSISGIDGSGKSVLAGRLLEACADLRVSVKLLRVDDFRRRVPWRQPGRSEADIYYEDYFDFAELDRQLAQALAPGPDLVMVEGVLVLRVPALANAYAIYLDVDESTARARILERDTRRGRTPEEVRHKMSQRYFPAQARYQERFDARTRAHLLVDNNDLMRPRVLRGDPDAGPAPLRAPLREILGGAP